MQQSENTGRRVLSAEREEEALRLRAQGKRESAIAEELGITQGAVSKLLTRARGRRTERIRALAQEALVDDLMKLDELDAVFMPLAITGDVRAADRVIAMINTRAKLLGNEKAPVAEFRQEPITAEEIAKMRAEATAEELKAIASGDTSVMIAVLSRAGVGLTK